MTIGELIFDWSAIDHVGITESYVTPGTTGTDESTPWDYFRKLESGDRSYLDAAYQTPI